MLKPTCLWFALLVGLSIIAPADDRKIKTQVTPAYPELMRRHRMGGTVKLRITINPDGRVTEAKAVGGHPMLIAPATEAVKQWKYEPGVEQTVTVIEIRFDPSNQ
jgi:TonB family protein